MTIAKNTNSTEKLNLASYIEHTLLKPEATTSQIELLCEDALKHSFKGVCVNSSYVSLAASKLKGSATLVVSVIGFPLGCGLSEAKAFEAELAAKNGAQEIDMVLHIGAVKEGRWSFIEQDIQMVTQAVNIPVKVILETGFLNMEEIKRACQVSEAAGALFVKTCTGFAPGVATVDHIQLMRANVSQKLGVKASGGIKTYEQAIDLIKAGATRLGTSSGVQLVTYQNVPTHSY